MPNIQTVKYENTQSKTREMLDQVKKKFGKVPNIVATMAHSPATLQAYLSFGEALAESSLSGKLQKQIALTVSQENGCDYCLAAYTATGKNEGMSEAQVIDARQALDPSDVKAQAALRFSRKLVEERGRVKADDLQKLRDVGYHDGEINEIFTTVMQTIYTNYFNHMAGTEVDFPEARELKAA